MDHRVDICGYISKSCTFCGDNGHKEDIHYETNPDCKRRIDAFFKNKIIYIEPKSAEDPQPSSRKSYLGNHKIRDSKLSATLTSNTTDRNLRYDAKKMPTLRSYKSTTDHRSDNRSKSPIISKRAHNDRRSGRHHPYNK